MLFIISCNYRRPKGSGACVSDFWIYSVLLSIWNKMDLKSVIVLFVFVNFVCIEAEPQDYNYENENDQCSDFSPEKQPDLSEWNYK